MSESVTISLERFRELLNAENELSCLHAGGVDNWTWYSASLEEYEDLTLEEARAAAPETI
jgi:hypothetical protein